MKLKVWLVLLGMALCVSEQRAQSAYAQVSAKRVQVGVPFEYAVVISANATGFTPPAFRDLDVVSGPNQSSSVQYVNGAMSQQMIFSYGLVARKEGKFTIGPAVIISGSQKFETNAVTVEAVKGAAGQGGDGGRTGSDDLYIKTTVSKNKFYLGEQVIIIQKVYSRNQIIGYHKSNPPSYDGFYAQLQESPTKGQLVMENVDGVNYYTHELFRTAVIANKAGKLTISPIEVEPVIRRQGGKPRNLFEQLLGGGGFEDVPVPVRSRPLTVEVLDLPEEGRPASFNGAVGNYSMRAELSRNEVKANDAVSLKLIVTGKGNLKLINAPALTLPADFESYEPKVSEGSGSKTFEYLIIPRKEGDYLINSLEFSFFSLDAKKYVTIPSPELRLKVLPPAPGSAGAQVYVPQHQVKESENDIRYIKKGNFVLSKREREFFNSAGHMAALGIPALALAVGLLLRKRYVRENSNLALVRERRAGRVARKRLARAESLMKENRKDAFYSETLTAMNDYLSYKLHIAVSDLSKEKILAALETRKVSAETVSKLVAQLESAEFARYAPAAASGDLRTAYADTAALIGRLESELNRKEG